MGFQKISVVANMIQLLFLIGFFLLPPAFASTSGNADGYSINGRVKIPGFGTKGLGLPGKISNVKVILNGGQIVSFLGPDGYFSFHNVLAGTHLIEVSAMGYFFSPVRVDVSARHPGKVQAALTENRRGLNELVLEPLSEEQYFEMREPFSVMSLVKSPMGMMIGFMVFAMVLMPKLMENIDPEEMKRAQEEMRSQGVPSLSSLLPGAGAAAAARS
ncbi:ER membrane protein complex subunit 7 homolog isoform X2 [Impatiens glandulifera]|uniref:ER membrane protein complex subunit 7 homolog isoform X2 n=1 Tax=Impatiens glandulifera TaxID=253017 RepID=UPI001FB172D8|nr:ER membrane protein complex subunit 7 homolog isoform X2 [Impatiens glandulifera]